MPALERAAAGRVRTAVRAVRSADLVRVQGWGAACVAGLEPATELWPRVAAGPLPRRLRAQLVQMRIERPVPGDGQAPVRLPDAHQRTHEVATAPPGLERLRSVAGAQPHG